MKPAARNFLLLTIFLSLLAWAVPARAATTRALFAWGTDDYFWSVDVNPSVTGDAPNGVLTSIRLRTAGDQLQWRNVGELSETPVSISNRGSELLVVLDDGEWKIVSESDVRSGNALPDDGRVMALAGDGDDVWAVAGFVPDAAPATMPAVTPAIDPATGLTLPTTAPTSRPAPARTNTRPTTASAAPQHPLELYLLHSGQWKAAGDIPLDFKAEQIAAVSLAVLDRKLTLAIVGPDRAIRVYTRAADHWSNGIEVGTFGDDAQLKLLGVRGRPALWLADGNNPGMLYFGSDGWTKPVKLAPAPKLSGFDCRSIAFALGQLRLLATDGKGRIAEQLYQADGTLHGDAKESMTVPSNADKRVSQVIQFVVLAALVAWMLGSLRQRPNMAEAMRRLNELNIAPPDKRLAGGLIDMIPMFVALAVGLILGHRSAQPATSGQTDFFSPEIICIACGIGLYFLHVTLSELLTGRSLGKWIAGTKVVSLDATPPRASQILARNALRLIDLIIVGIPLLSVLQTPLRQRVGDMMAGTIVVMASTTIEGGDASKPPPDDRP